MYPLRGLWNNAPPEGDRFIACEIDWTVTVPAGQGVQCALSGNSPVAFSQIVSIAVDNARCGSDVQFIFTDSGFVLQVPAYNQGIYPVFTNALMFYVYANNSAAGDITTFTIHNSMPPPVQISSKQEVNTAGVAAINLEVAGSTVIVPPPSSGTVTTINVSISATAAGTANLQLVDGTGKIVWIDGVTFEPGNTSITIPGLSIRFFNGLSFVVTAASTANALASVNIYYGVP